MFELCEQFQPFPSIFHPSEETAPEAERDANQQNDFQSTES